MQAASGPIPGGEALPVKPHRRLPADSGLSLQDVWDPAEAAREGRVASLRRLQEAGRFLDFYSPHRETAGEACKAEAWLAALAACKAGHAQVLRWLFRGGWPEFHDVEPPWHLRDMVESLLEQFGSVPLVGHVDPWQSHVDYHYVRWVSPSLPCLAPEVELYRSAMRDPACLHALLDAGARSAWICRAAVLEGKPHLLKIAVARGCPCDAECVLFAAREGQVETLEEILQMGLNVIIETTYRLFPKHHFKLGRLSNLVKQAGVEAAGWGREACLEALLRSHPEPLCESGKWNVSKGCEVVVHAAARAGHLNCLQLLDRYGCEGWSDSVQAAANKPDNVACLEFTLKRDPEKRNFLKIFHYTHLTPMHFAAESGSEANLRFLDEAGCRWNGKADDLLVAMGTGDVGAVRFCLSHQRLSGDAHEWSSLMEKAIDRRSPALVRLLYESGCRPSCRVRGHHPVKHAIACNTLALAQIAVQYGGVPPVYCLDTQVAAQGGEAMLRYVHGLGGKLTERTAMLAARGGQLGALRYAVQNGAPWDERTLVEAISGDSLDCLRYAHEAGCPLQSPSPDLFVPARSLPVLRYVCEHMDPTWGTGVLQATAKHLADRITRADAGGSFDWEMALYTLQQLKKCRQLGILAEDPPAPFVAAAIVRRERAAALAGTFFKTGRLAQREGTHSWSPLWRSMAAVPSQLREKVAYEAHLVLPYQLRQAPMAALQAQLVPAPQAPRRLLRGQRTPSGKDVVHDAGAH